MAMNYPGPYELRTIYRTTVEPGGARQHTMRLNIDLVASPLPGADFGDIDVKNGAGDTKNLATITTELTGLLLPHFSTTNMELMSYEVWRYDVGTFDATYVTGTLIGVPGSTVSPPVPAGQVFFTFRTTGGGNMRLVLMESVTTPGVAKTYSELNSVTQDLINYFTDEAEGWFLGRDNTYPLVFLRFLPGQNEATFRARFR